MADPGLRHSYARLTAAILRMLPPEAAAPFFAGPGWTGLTPEAQDLIIEADAAMEEAERRQRQEARQHRAETRAAGPHM